MSAKKKDPKNVTLADLVSSKDIVENAVERLIHGADDNLHDQVRRAVTEKLGKLVEKITEEEVRKILVAELKDGWPEYSRWGQSNKRVPLAQHVTTMLETKSNWDGYGDRTEQTWLQWVMRKTIKEIVDKELGEEAKAARVKFAAMVDDVIKSKFAETIRTALGLK